MSNARDLGGYVRERRRAAGLNQTDLAKKAAVSRRWLSDLESGKPTIEVGLIFRVFAALGLYLAALPEPADTLDLDNYLDTFGNGS
ncbi:helix-turn-helix domain-containing protein [Micromonosporaceae bacterium Da 78-11]